METTIWLVLCCLMHDNYVRNASITPDPGMFILPVHCIESERTIYSMQCILLFLPSGNYVRSASCFREISTCHFFFMFSLHFHHISLSHYYLSTVLDLCAKGKLLLRTWFHSLHQRCSLCVCVCALYQSQSTVILCIFLLLFLLFLPYKKLH